MRPRLVDLAALLPFVYSNLLFFSAHANAMWPKPQGYEQGSSTLWMAPDVGLTYKSLRIPDEEFSGLWIAQQPMKPAGNSSETKRLRLPPEVTIQSAFGRFKSSVFEESFVPEKFYPRNADFEPSLDGPKTYIQEIVVEEHDRSRTAKGSELASNEAYTLEVAEDGRVTIQATSYHGVLHALETLKQLLYGHSDSTGEVYLPNAPATIRDQPAFAHRGLNLDIARNCIYPGDVLRTLRGMAANKLNRLHIHATDSQSWPLEIPSIPSLARAGAYHRRQIWTAADLKAVQEYGAARGIEVYLEVDMPGHTGSVAHSHPDLVVGHGAQWDVYAVEPPAGQLKLAHAGVPPFLAALLSDLLPRLAPYSSLFHIGMDELNLRAYELEPGLATSSRAALTPHLQALLDRVFAQLAAHGLTPLAWEELVLDWDLRVPAHTVVQTWRSAGALAQVVARGHTALFGAAGSWYLDTGLGGFADPDPARGPDSRVRPPFHDWLPPYKNWRAVLAYAPLEGVPAAHRARVLGGEVHLWGELTDSVSLDGMLWPRAAAAAEVLWSGQGTVGEDATRRLAAMRERLVLGGIGAGVVQMEWCLRNEGGCLM